MMDYANTRTVEVRLYNGMPLLPESSLEAVIVARVDPQSVGADELAEFVQKTAIETVGSHVLDDQRHYTNWGASGAGQTVIVSVLQVAIDPVIAGTAGALVAELAAWAKGTRDRQEERNRKVPGYEPPPTMDLKSALHWTRRYIADHFGVTLGNLIVEEAQAKPDGASIVLRDTERGHVYTAELSEDGNLMRFSEHRPQEQKDNKA